MEHFSLNVNGQSFEANAPANTLLVEILREKMMLKGTHIGCETSQCGACQVQVDGQSIKSCAMFAVEAIGSEIITIEGIENCDGSLSVIQEAFREHHGLQCGFCTPGMIITAIDLLKTNKNPSDGEIRKYLEGNICRCTGYHNIIKAIKSAAFKLADGAKNNV